jgi:hypothetical protein
MYPPEGHDPNRSTRAERARPAAGDGWQIAERSDGPKYDKTVKGLVDEKYVQWSGGTPLTLQLPDNSDIRNLTIPATAATLSVYAGASVGPGSLLFTVTGKNTSARIPQGHPVLTIVSSAAFVSSIPVFISADGDVAQFSSDSIASLGPITIAGSVGVTPVAGQPLSVAPNAGSTFPISAAAALPVNGTVAVTPVAGQPLSVTPNAGATFPISAAAAIPISAAAALPISGNTGALSGFPAGANPTFGSYTGTATTGAAVISIGSPSAGKALYLSSFWVSGVGRQPILWTLTYQNGATFIPICSGYGDIAQSFSPPLQLNYFGGTPFSLSLALAVAPLGTLNIALFANGYVL